MYSKSNRKFSLFDAKIVHSSHVLVGLPHLTMIGSIIMVHDDWF